MKKLLPVALNLENRAVLVVGGGKVAARKAGALVECGARVTVIAPVLQAGFPPVFEHRARDFESGDGAGFSLIFACTDKREVNAHIAGEAKKAGIWCNLADAPQDSDFHTAATFRRGEICVGVTTGGQSPLLAKHISAQIEAAIGPEYQALAGLLAGREVETSQRGDFWRRLLESDVLALLRAGKHAEAEKLVCDIVENDGERVGEATQ